MSVDASRLSAALRAQAVALAAIADALDDQEPAAVGTVGTPAAVAAQPAAPAKRGRGRPVQGETPPSASASPAPSPAATEADPFGGSPAAAAAPTLTQDDVRNALVALKDATSQDNALKVLKDSSGGVSTLPQLPADKYATVVAACKAAMPGAAAPATDPFEVSTAASVQTNAPSLEDVKAAVVEAQKRTATDTVQQVVMAHGGKAPGPNGAERPSLKALPVPSYAAVIAAVKALPTTKS